MNRARRQEIEEGKKRQGEEEWDLEETRNGGRG
jgi:hypothetical protein